MNVTDIIKNLNAVFEKIFKSIEGEIYTDSIIKKRNLFEIMGYLISNAI